MIASLVRLLRRWLVIYVCVCVWCVCLCVCARDFAAELAVLSYSYDLLKAEKPDTPPVYFLRALYNENNRAFRDVGPLPLCVCVCRERGCQGVVNERLW